MSDTARIELSGLDQALSAHFVRRPIDEFAYCGACPLSKRFPSCDVACQRSLMDWIEAEHSTISALVVEPALGARGYIAPPNVYWHRLRELTNRYGILMVADEIQMGLGRAGDWLLSKKQGWYADLVCLGKSLGGGIVPVSAVIGRGDVLDSLEPGTESETFAASPLGMAIGQAVIDELEKGLWFARADAIGQTLCAGLRECIRTDGTGAPVIEKLGASVAIEFFPFGRNHDNAALQDRQQMARQFAESLVAAGMLVHYSGPYYTRIVFLPPLTIGDDEIAEIIQRIASIKNKPMSPGSVIV